MTSRVTKHGALALTLALSIATGIATGIAAQGDEDGVRTTIHSFADGVAGHDTALLERTLHAASVQFILGPTVTRLERDAYLDLVRAKKLGGQPLQVGIQRVTITGRTAHANATFTSSTATLTHALSLVRAGDQWVIVSGVVVATPK